MRFRAFFQRSWTAFRWAWSDVFGPYAHDVYPEPKAPVKSDSTTHYWQFSLGGHGKAGEEKTFVHDSQVDFEIEKIIVQEESKRPGLGVKITNMFVGNKHQIPAFGTGVLSYAFSSRVTGNRLRLDRLRPGMPFAVTVKYLEDCNWHCTFLGKATRLPAVSLEYTVQPETV